MTAAVGIVKSLTIVMRRIAGLPKGEWPEAWFATIAPREDEKPAAYGARVRAAIGQRWGYSSKAISAFEGVTRVLPSLSPSKDERWPKDCPPFLEDLGKYGGVKFLVGAGEVDQGIVPGTLDTGMDAITYIRIAPRTGGGTSEDMRKARAAQVQQTKKAMRRQAKRASA